MNRTTLAKRYLPLAAVVGIQLFIISVVPSTAPGELVSAATGGRSNRSSVSAGDNSTVDNGTGAATDTGTAGTGGVGTTGTGGTGTAAGNLPPGVTAKGDELKKKDFYPALIVAGSTGKGETHLLGMGADAHTVHYNKQMLAEAGLAA